MTPNMGNETEKMKQTNKERRCPKCNKFTLLKIDGKVSTCVAGSPTIITRTFYRLENRKEIDHPLNEKDKYMCVNCYATFANCTVNEQEKKQ